jgi:hypothetical protein
MSVDLLLGCLWKPPNEVTSSQNLIRAHTSGHPPLLLYLTTSTPIHHLDDAEH